jgi:hypothetical protein
MHWDAVCADCATGKFQDQVNRPTCKSFFSCTAGHFVSRAGTATSDRECSLCAVGTANSQANAPQCADCTPGHAQNEPGQQQCLECGLGGYTNASKATACERIPKGFYGVGGSPTTRTDVKRCEPGFACPGGAAQRTACDGISTFQPDAGTASCLTVSTCAAGKFSALEPTPVSDRKCSDCSPGTFMDRFAHTEASCKRHKTCQPGTFIAAPGTNFSDVVCGACDGVTGFSALPDQRTCTPIDHCEPGEFVARKGSPTRSQQCQSCAEGKFSLFLNSDECRDWTVCKAGTRVLNEPTSDTDRVCVSCIAGQSFSSGDNAGTARRSAVPRMPDRWTFLGLGQRFRRPTPACLLAL